MAVLLLVDGMMIMEFVMDDATCHLWMGESHMFRLLQESVAPCFSEVMVGAVACGRNTHGQCNIPSKDLA